MAVPALPQPAFTALFNDVSKDPFDGTYGPLFAPFDISLTDANATSDNIHQQIAAASNQRSPLDNVLLVNRLICVYCLPVRRNQAVGTAPVPALDGKFICLRWQTHPRPWSSGEYPCPVDHQDCPSLGSNPRQHLGATGCRCLTHSHLGPLYWWQSRHCGNQNPGTHGPSP
jgi:hypothetical protein